MKSPTKVITGNVTLSYVNLVNPKSINGSTPRYGCSVLIEKSDKKTIDAINAGIAAAYEADIAKLKGNSKIAPPLIALKTPIRDGDAERPGDEAYANRFFLNAHANSKPGIVQITQREPELILEPITDPDEIYSGMKAKVSLSFFGYNNSGNKGIGVSINNVLKVGDGPRLGGKASAAEDFGDLADDDDDMLN